MDLKFVRKKKKIFTPNSMNRRTQCTQCIDAARMLREKLLWNNCLTVLIVPGLADGLPFSPLQSTFQDYIKYCLYLRTSKQYGADVCMTRQTHLCVNVTNLFLVIFKQKFCFLLSCERNCTNREITFIHQWMTAIVKLGLLAFKAGALTREDYYCFSFQLTGKYYWFCSVEVIILLRAYDIHWNITKM